MSSFKSRVLVAVIGVPVLVWVVLWAPSIVMMAALALLAGIAAHELMQCVGLDKTSFLLSWTMISAIFSVEWYYDRPSYIVVWWTIYVVTAFIYAIVKAGEVKFVQVLAGIFAVMFIPYSFSAFLRLESSGLHRAYLLLPFILSFACDTFAYFAGMAFGKHKLAPKVSPKKSIEGSIGGLLGNLLCGLLFAFVMDRWFGGSIGYGSMAVLALACGVVAQVGDLSFSLIKREFGIKDYGHLFLAHGGVLDRFDSVLFVTPVIEIILSFVK
ncbi:phosphatidate cytidylyltransferase [Dysosmobacter sp. Sow4_B12]|uniref:phosphatidate cytidylyltransferase n=1 Tax=Dysosmobacter sp. Sow4_B12 TaxID=3438777 RepID=UPI003F8FBC9B